jgi:hypothetical protein
MAPQGLSCWSSELVTNHVTIPQAPWGPTITLSLTFFPGWPQATSLARGLGRPS